MPIDEQAAATLRAEQAKRLEVELIEMVRDYGLILRMNPKVRNTIAKVAQFNDFQQLAKEL
jgi:hypothetical protein